MDERALTGKVIRECGRHGLLVHHCPDSRRCTGTPGLPDLIVLGGREILLAELKGRDGETSSVQDLWLYHLHQAGVPYYVWRPQDWEAGTIQEALEKLAA